LDASQKNVLVDLYCDSNQLTSLNIDGAVLLNFLNCRYNKILELDLSSNTNLYYSFCSDNKLSCVNLKNGNNPNISYIDFRNNPTLACIEVDDSASTWSSFNVIRDPGVIYSNNCNNACSATSI
jgi:trimeric autotransporter adhesin